MGLSIAASQSLSPAQGIKIIIIPENQNIFIYFIYWTKLVKSVVTHSLMEKEVAQRKEKEESLRLAIAVSLLRSKKIQNRQSTSLCDAPSETNPLRWKQKNRRSSSRGDAHLSASDALRWKQKVPSRICLCVLGGLSDYRIWFSLEFLGLQCRFLFVVCLIF